MIEVANDLADNGWWLLLHHTGNLRIINANEGGKTGKWKLEAVRLDLAAAEAAPAQDL